MATRIFLCSGKSLSKRVKTLGGQCFSSHFRNSGPFHHLLTLITSHGFSPRDNISAGLSEDATWRQCLISVKRWISPTKFATKTDYRREGRLSSLTRSSSPTKDKSGISRVPMTLWLCWLSAPTARRLIALIALTRRFWAARREILSTVTQSDDHWDRAWCKDIYKLRTRAGWRHKIRAFPRLIDGHWV